MEGRTLAKARLDPDAATVHLDNLLRDGEAESGAALGLGVGAVYLVELLEDAGELIGRNAGARVGDAHGEMAVGRACRDAHLPCVGELDGVADEVEQNLGEALLVAKAERLGLARLRPAATLSRGLKGQELTDFAALRDAGAVMITDDGIPVTDGHLMRRACEYALEHGLVVQTHSEDPALRQNGVMNEGAVSQRLGLPGNPVAAEAAMIYRDCEVAALTGGRVHIAHVSSKRGMQVVEFFKAQGAPVTCEVTPHHLTLTDEVMATFDPVHKVAPPLRTAEDVLYLREAVKRGVVDNIGTDHAPHTRAEKDRDMVEAPFGIGNIEVTFPLLYTELVEKEGLPLGTLLHLLQAGPAAVMGWDRPTLVA